MPEHCLDVVRGTHLGPAVMTPHTKGRTHDRNRAVANLFANSPCTRRPVHTWFTLSDPAAEEALYDSISMRQFVGIDLGRERVPDETTILNFRHLLERHDLTQALFDRMNAYLASRGLQVKGGTIVDATIIAAPSSTKNQTETRDPEMRQ